VLIRFNALLRKLFVKAIAGNFLEDHLIDWNAVDSHLDA